MRFVVAFLIAAALPLYSEAGGPVKQIRYVMGTVCEIEAYPAQGQGETETSVALDAAFRELTRLDHMLSNWDPESELMVMNRLAAQPGEPRPWVPVSRELYHRLQRALELAADSGGTFDPTVGPLVRAWGFLPNRNGPKLEVRSKTAELEKVRERVGFKKVRLNPNESAVQFAVPGMEIDLSGIAKGYAVMRAAFVLKQHGIHNALISLGSSSVAALGSPPGKHGWRLLIRDPIRNSRSAGSLILRDGESLATSGTYEHTKGKGPLQRSHIIDPATGEAIGGTRSATVISRDGELADALAKPFLLLKSGTGEVNSLLNGWPGTSVILLYGDEPAPRAIVAGPAGDSIRLAEVWRAGIRVAAGRSRSSH